MRGDPKPLVLLDVDGPLNPWAAKAPPDGYVEFRWRLSRWSRKTQHAWLNPAHGPALLDLAERVGADLAWATTWEDRANATIGPALGLPVLPVVGLRAYEGRPGWKYAAVGRFAAGRPLAWVDDDFGLFPSAREAFLQRRRDVTALIPVDPATGLTEEHFAAVAEALGT
ncbi:HAD domain-containing protein [Actinosynnema sp. CS-041913]|uniref:HAD domain-containing protein n=1 Tax=Actinosynnema sp. CS-041913 TaxID=3239917 RepID=UPI003D8F6EFA